MACVRASPVEIGPRIRFLIQFSRGSFPEVFSNTGGTRPRPICSYTLKLFLVPFGFARTDSLSVLDSVRVNVNPNPAIAGSFYELRCILGARSIRRISPTI